MLGVLNEFPVAKAAPPEISVNHEVVPPAVGTADKVSVPVPHRVAEVSDAKPAAQLWEESESVYWPMLP